MAMVVVSAINCSSPKSERLFVSDCLQDTLESYLDRIDCSSYKDYGVAPATTVILFKKGSDSLLRFETSYSPALLPFFDSAVVNQTYRGMIKGHYVFMLSNPELRPMTKWKTFSLTTRQKDSLRAMWEIKEELAKKYGLYEGGASLREYRIHNGDSLEFLSGCKGTMELPVHKTGEQYFWETIQDAYKNYLEEMKYDPDDFNGIGPTTFVRIYAGEQAFILDFNTYTGPDAFAPDPPEDEYLTTSKIDEAFVTVYGDSRLNEHWIRFSLPKSGKDSLAAINQHFKEINGDRSSILKYRIHKTGSIERIEEMEKLF